MGNNFLKQIGNFFEADKPVFWLYIIIPIFAASQQIAIGPRDIIYTNFNNYVIFKDSYLHLIAYKDLYAYHVTDYFDLYKYSPTFACLMLPFAYLPEKIGLYVWDFLNCFLVYFGIKKLPFLTNPHKNLSLWFAGHELLTATQNSQSNALLAGLMLLAFAAFENKKPGWASLLLLLGVFTKPFLLAGFVLGIFYPNKAKLIFYSIGWTVILLALPYLFVSHGQVVFLYNSWYQLLSHDHGASVGLSVMGFFYQVFGIDFKTGFLLAGTLFLLLPLVFIKKYESLVFRMLMLSSLLIWMVIFNHKAESPTFIIAVCGVAVWYFTGPKDLISKILLFFCLYLTQLSSSDVFFPAFLRNEFVNPYELKVLPCLLIWLMILYRQIVDRPKLNIAS